MSHQAPLSGHDHLQQRLEKTLAGAPASPVLTRILELLYSPEDAELASKLPMKPKPVHRLAERWGMDPSSLADRITDMANRGLVVDFEIHGKRFACLAPMVIGFFEYTFMRVREDVPQPELARLFEQYMEEDDRFSRSAFSGTTQFGRSLVHEEALLEGDHTEILDWERASHAVSTAKAIGLSLCACRHKKKFLDQACAQPLEACISLNSAAKVLIDSGHSKDVPVSRAMELLQSFKASGLAQTGDNVQRNLTYICNCCGCCCGMMQGLRRFDIKQSIVSSSWMAEVDESRCKGCGLCVKACPVRAISLDTREDPGQKGSVALRDETLCLGCGVCTSACKTGALRMRSRARKVIPPETTFDRIVAMAIERGKLSDLLFDDPTSWSHQALGRVASMVERSPAFKAAMAVKPLRSVFLSRLASGAKKGVKLKT